VFSLDEMMAREVMVPRTAAFLLSLPSSPLSPLPSLFPPLFSLLPFSSFSPSPLLFLLPPPLLFSSFFLPFFSPLPLRPLFPSPLFFPSSLF
ncbi:hypothetical protein ACXWR7_10480, partial [Streptococcus pyogenes]